MRYFIENQEKFNKMSSKYECFDEMDLLVLEPELVSFFEMKDELILYREVIMLDCVQLLTEAFPFKNNTALASTIFSDLVEFGIISHETRPEVLECRACSQCSKCYDFAIQHNYAEYGELLANIQNIVNR